MCHSMISYSIVETEFLSELKNAYDSYALRFDDSRKLVTYKPVAGAILKVKLAPVDASDACVNETQLELPGGGRILCCAYNYRGTARIFSTSQNVNMIDFSKDPTLFFVCPAKRRSSNCTSLGRLLRAQWLLTNNSESLCGWCH